MEEPTNRHPFLEGLSSHRGAFPTAIVIFGASGDLTARKLMPALYNLGVDNLLPADFFFIGYGRREMVDDAFRSSMLEAVCTSEAACCSVRADRSPLPRAMVWESA